MLNAQNWVEALQINPEKLSEWSALAPDGVPLLVWCLQEGHIPVDKYLEWASHHFQIPVVKRAYFEGAFSTETALKLHKEATTSVEWTPWFFPVEQWENVTLVACVEPPADFAEPNFRCVLADALMLKEAWYKFMAPKGEGVKEESVISAPSMPIGMETSQISTQVKPFKLSLDDLDPDNMFKKMEPNKDELYSGQVEEEPAKPAPPAPEKVAHKIPALPSEEASVVAEIDVDIDNEGSMMHTNLDLSKLSALPPEPEEPRAPTPPVPAEQPKPHVKPPTGTPKPTPKKAGAASATKFTPEEQNEIIDETFTQLKGLYQNCFLMKCEDGKAKLYKWDATMKPNNGGKNIAVDLAFPTFFRILHKTNLPYHGYLVDSPAHRSFFNELKVKDLPACVTAIPIKNESALVGVLVCIGDEPMQKLDMLRKAEESAAKLLEVMAPAWASSAAA